MHPGLIVILLFGAGLPLLSFFTALYYLKKNQGREDRINRVVRQTLDGPRDTAGLFQRLCRSGVLDLENNREIVEACYRIEMQCGENPIPGHWGLASEDLGSFFIYTSVHQIDLNQTSIQKVIQDYYAQRGNKAVLKAVA